MGTVEELRHVTSELSRPKLPGLYCLIHVSPKWLRISSPTRQSCNVTEGREAFGGVI